MEIVSDTDKIKNMSFPIPNCFCVKFLHDLPCQTEQFLQFPYVIGSIFYPTQLVKLVFPFSTIRAICIVDGTHYKMNSMLWFSGLDKWDGLLFLFLTFFPELTFHKLSLISDKIHQEHFNPVDYECTHIVWFWLDSNNMNKKNQKYW